MVAAAGRRKRLKIFGAAKSLVRTALQISTVAMATTDVT